jgi:hypothetical protein
LTCERSKRVRGGGVVEEMGDDLSKGQ